MMMIQDEMRWPHNILKCTAPQLAGGGGEAQPAQPLAVRAGPGEAGGRSGDQGAAEAAGGPLHRHGQAAGRPGPTLPAAGGGWLDI